MKLTVEIPDQDGTAMEFRQVRMDSSATEAAYGVAFTVRAILPFVGGCLTRDLLLEALEDACGGDSSWEYKAPSTPIK